MPIDFEEFSRQVALAAADGRHMEAFDLIRARMIQDAFDWLEEEGVKFARVGKGTQSEYLRALADACDGVVRKRGAEAGSRLHIAADVFKSLVVLDTVLKKPAPSDEEGRANRLAEIMFAAATLGAVDGTMTFERLGYFQKLAAGDLVTDRRRQGARATNAKRRAAHDRALAVAKEIFAINPSLPPEELAIKIQRRAELNTTLKTIGEWVRRWRREGQFERPTQPFGGATGQP